MKTLFVPSILALILASCGKPETADTGTPVTDTMETAMTSEAKPYPLETCLVSGEELGSMGEPISIVHEGQTIKFCCDSCLPKFKKDPAMYLSKLENKS